MTVCTRVLTLVGWCLACIASGFSVGFSSPKLGKIRSTPAAMAPRRRNRRGRGRGGNSHLNMDFIAVLSTSSKAITLEDLGFSTVNRPIRVRSIDVTFAIASSASQIPTIQFLISGPNKEHVVRSANVVVTPTRSRLRLTSPTSTDYGTFTHTDPLVTMFMNGHKDGVVTVTGSVRIQFSQHSGPHNVALIGFDAETSQASSMVVLE